MRNDNDQEVSLGENVPGTSRSTYRVSDVAAISEVVSSFARKAHEDISSTSKRGGMKKLAL